MRTVCGGLHVEPFTSLPLRSVILLRSLERKPFYATYYDGVAIRVEG